MNNQWQFCKFLAQTGPTTMSRPITRCFCSNGYLLLYSSFTKQLNCRSKSIVSFLLIFTESTLHLWWLSIEPFFLLFFDSDLYVAQFLIWSCLGFMFTSLFATISFPAWSFISRSVNNEYCQFFFFSWLHLINVDTSSFYLQFRPSVFLFFFFILWLHLQLCWSVKIEAIFALNDLWLKYFSFARWREQLQIQRKS